MQHKHDPPFRIMARTLCVVGTSIALTSGAACTTAEVPSIPLHHTPWNAITKAPREPSGPSEPTANHPLPPLPPHVVQSAKTACSFHAPQLSRPIHLGLSVGRLYATIEDAQDVHMRIPVGNASQGAHVGVRAGGVYLAGIIPPTDVALLPAKPFAAAECLVPESSMPVAWTQASPGRIQVRLPLDGHVHLVRGEPIVERACEDLSLDQHNFLPSELFTPEEPTYRPLRKGMTGLSVSSLVGGRRIATIDLLPAAEGIDTPVVMVLEQAGTRTRIGWPGDGQLVFGWVESSVLDLSGEPVNVGGLLDSATESESSSGLWETDDATEVQTGTTCAWNAPLVARVGRDMAVVGTISPGMALDTGSVEGEFRQVRIPLTTMTPAADVTFLVPEAQLYPCPGR